MKENHNKMDIQELRQHVRSIISERVYSKLNESVDTDNILNDFIESVNRQKGIKDDAVRPLNELEGTAFVFGKDYDFEFGYDVYSRQYVKAHRGGYDEPEYDELGGTFAFDITSAKVFDEDGEEVCDFDEIVNRLDKGYDTVKEWFVFEPSVEIEDNNPL